MMIVSLLQKDEGKGCKLGASKQFKEMRGNNNNKIMELHSSVVESKLDSACTCDRPIVSDLIRKQLASSNAYTH